MAHFSGSKPGEACLDILYLFKVACTITLAYRYERSTRPFAGAHGTIFFKGLKTDIFVGAFRSFIISRYCAFLTFKVLNPD